nr:hypothetical protein [Gammaproteobacteria bacterium]
PNFITLREVSRVLLKAMKLVDGHHDIIHSRDLRVTYMMQIILNDCLDFVRDEIQANKPRMTSNICKIVVNFTFSDDSAVSYTI